MSRDEHLANLIVQGVKWIILKVKSGNDINRKKRRGVKGKEGDIYITLIRLVIMVLISPIY